MEKLEQGEKRKDSNVRISMLTARKIRAAKLVVAQITEDIPTSDYVLQLALDRLISANAVQREGAANAN